MKPRINISIYCSKRLIGEDRKVMHYFNFRWGRAILKNTAKEKSTLSFYLKAMLIMKKSK